MFTRMLEHARRRPGEFAALARDLFGAMATGGRIGFEAVAHFNGGLFDDDTALPMEREEIGATLKAAALDWSEIDPSIFGTLFERGLDPDKRSQLGAHYTDRDKIMQIVEPVIVRPLLAEWEIEKARIAAAIAKEDRARPARRRRKGPVKIAPSQGLLNAFLKRLQDFTVLDPACDSGNFLYLALRALKDLEHRVQLEGEAMGLERSLPAVGPTNVKGLEVNAYAAELARVSVWIGDIQWMRRNGFRESRDPILKPLETIECRDAILASDGSEPDWPHADAVIGNPPFLGGKKLIDELGEDYVPRMFSAWTARVPPEADLVCYWFVKAGEQMTAGRAKRVGLVATNSIRGGANRRALRAATAGCTIFDAWSDEPWVIDGAAVRVSLVCFSRADDAHVSVRRLDGQPVDKIHADRRPAGAAPGPISPVPRVFGEIGASRSWAIRRAVRSKSPANLRGSGGCASRPIRTGCPTPMFSSLGSTAWT